MAIAHVVTNPAVREGGVICEAAKNFALDWLPSPLLRALVGAQAAAPGRSMCAALSSPFY